MHSSSACSVRFDDFMYLRDHAVSRISMDWSINCGMHSCSIEIFCYLVLILMALLCRSLNNSRRREEIAHL